MAKASPPVFPRTSKEPGQEPILAPQLGHSLNRGQQHPASARLTQVSLRAPGRETGAAKGRARHGQKTEVPPPVSGDRKVWGWQRLPVRVKLRCGHVCFFLRLLCLPLPVDLVCGTPRRPKDEGGKCPRVPGPRDLRFLGLTGSPPSLSLP